MYIRDEVLYQECDNCGETVELPLKDIRITWNPDFNEWDNLVIECECGSGAAYNLNIPENDTGEPFETGDLPVEEEIQRHYVRVLQRIVREDFKKNE